MKYLSLLLLLACTPPTTHDEALCLASTRDNPAGLAYDQGFSDGAACYEDGTSPQYNRGVAPPLLRTCYVLGYDHGEQMRELEEECP